MIRQAILSGSILVIICGCNIQSAKLLTKSAYAGESLNNTFVIVLSDENTESCLKYYMRFLVDSLKSNNVAADGIFNCCIDKKSDIQSEIVKLLPEVGKYKTVLSVVITKTVVGYGTTSQRELQLNLMDFNRAEMAWSGKLSSSFDWFISDENYKAVAGKMVKATLKELRNQKILDENI